MAGLTNIRSQLLWVPAGGVRSVSVTFAPPQQAPWTHLEVQLGWIGGVSAARAYCESYRYVIGDQSGVPVGLRLLSGWVQGLVSATFTLVVEGNGYAAAVAKLTTWQ